MIDVAQRKLHDRYSTEEVLEPALLLENLILQLMGKLMKRRLMHWNHLVMQMMLIF